MNEASRCAKTGPAVVAAALCFLAGVASAAGPQCSPTLPEQCSPASTCATTDDGNFDVKLVSAVYNGTNTTYTYQLCGNPPTQNLSHWVLGLLCTDAVVSGGEVVTPDPTTCLAGVKFDTPGGVLSCCDPNLDPGCISSDCATGTLFQFTLAGNTGLAPLPVGSTIATKAGQLVETACVEGPDCCAASGQCDDQNPCTVDACSGGACSHTPLVCDDDDACTSDGCDVNSGCQFNPIVCDDNSACTNDTCNPQTGCVFTDIPCTDGNACTADDCDPQTGCAFTPITCDDNSACTNDTCNPQTGCVFADITCNDNSACTTDGCDPQTGCTSTPIVCNDGDLCTTDGCDPQTGCTTTPISCPDDGQFCNGTESCVEGSCQSSGSPCPNGTVCDENDDSCPQCLDAGQCADGDPCTDDQCVGGTCQHPQIPCDDGSACTTNVCDGGQCVFTSITCVDGDACTADSCDPQTGCDFPPIPCTDGDACTADDCDPQTGCTFPPITCADNSACTNDACDPQTGCVFTDITCDDTDPCTTATCDPDTGCVFIALDCDDGLSCTADTCVDGQCVNTPDACCTAEECDDQNACTTDACDTGAIPSVCTNDPVTGLPDEGSGCTPGQLCPECTDGLDNDCDGLVDCRDETICFNEQRPNSCPRIINDPGSIRFHAPNTGGLDRVNISGKLPIAAGVTVDPLNEEVAFVLTNANGGVVYAGAVIPGDLTPNVTGNRFTYRDRSARSGGSRRFGLERIRLRKRPDIMSFGFRAYARVSDVSDYMTLQMYVGDDVFVTTLQWVRTPHGWKVAGGQRG